MQTLKSRCAGDAGNWVNPGKDQPIGSSYIEEQGLCDSIRATDAGEHPSIQ